MDYTVFIYTERKANQHGGVAVLSKKGIQAIKVEGYECSFCCCISLENHGLVVLYDPPITWEYRIPDELVFYCLSLF